MSRLIRNIRGTTAVEYAVMLMLVAIAIMAAVPTISAAVIGVFNEVASRLVAGS